MVSAIVFDAVGAILCRCLGTLGEELITLGDEEHMALHSSISQGVGDPEGFHFKLSPFSNPLR
jgi:hypothetical protein